MASRPSPGLLKSAKVRTIFTAASQTPWLVPRTTSSASQPNREPHRTRGSAIQQQRCPHSGQRRALSTTRSLLGGRAAGHTSDRKRGRMEERMQQKQLEEQATKQPSLRVRMKHLFQSDEVPEDLGLFPSTLIMPVSPDVPGILALKRWKMEFRRLYKRGQDFVGVIALKATVGFFKHKLQLRKTAGTAMGLHRQVYAAYADGDETEIQRVATEGVRNRLINEIQARSNNTAYYWDLVRYVGRARVVSHRASSLPIPETGDDAKSIIRQAVVRLQSVQRLTREDFAEENEVEQDALQPAETEKNVVEYVVIQKRVLRGVEEPWKFWGTTGPTKMEDFDSTLENQPPPANATM